MDAPETLRHFKSVLAVCAHPDDESFGLGAVVVELRAKGSRVSVLCFTRGEASTLHGVPGDLTDLRAKELGRAARELGVESTRLLDYPDGALSRAPLQELHDEVVHQAGAVGADLLLVFDDGGITGHPDHRQATAVGVMTGETLGVPVLAWAIPQRVAAALNAEFGAAFVGRDRAEVDFVIDVDRRLQDRAIGHHRSQATDDHVLRRRLELLGPTEWLRWLLPPQGLTGGTGALTVHAGLVVPGRGADDDVEPVEGVDDRDQRDQPG